MFKINQFLIIFTCFLLCNAAEKYRFEFGEAQGNVTYESNNGYVGELRLGAVFNTEEYISAPSSLEFVTDQSYAYFSPHPEYDVGYVDFTLEFFFKMKSTLMQYPYIWVKEIIVSQSPWQSLRNYGIFTWPRIYNAEPHKLNLIFSSMLTPNTWTASGNYDLNDTQWHHIAAVYLHNQTKVRLYIDFTLDAELISTTTVPGDNVGTGGIASGSYWTGLIDSVVMHDFAMDLNTLRSTALARVDGNVEICDGDDNDGDGVADDGLPCALSLDASFGVQNQTSACACGTGSEVRVCQKIQCEWLVYSACDVTCPPTIAPSNAPSLAPSPKPTKRPTFAPVMIPGQQSASTLTPVVDVSTTTAESGESSSTLTGVGVSQAGGTTLVETSAPNGDSPGRIESTQDNVSEGPNYALLGGAVGGGAVVSCIVVGLVCLLLMRRQRRVLMQGRQHASRTSQRRNASLAGSRSGYASRRLAGSGGGASRRSNYSMGRRSNYGSDVPLSTFSSSLAAHKSPAALPGHYQPAPAKAITSAHGQYGSAPGKDGRQAPLVSAYEAAPNLSSVGSSLYGPAPSDTLSEAGGEYMQMPMKPPQNEYVAPGGQSEYVAPSGQI